MNQQQQYSMIATNFNDQALSVVQHGEDWWMTAEQIGQALGYSHPRQSITKIFNRHKDEFEKYSCEVKMTSHDHDGREVLRDVRIFNEEGVMLLCMFSKQPIAKAFRQWAVDVLKAYRHGKLISEHAELSVRIAALEDKLETLLPKPRKPRHPAGWTPVTEPPADHVTEAEKAEMLKLRGLGWGFKTIARQLCRDKKTVKRWVH